MLLGLATVALCLAADAPSDAAKKEQELLQGDWTLASGERAGEQIPEDLAKSLKRTIKGDVSTVTRDDQPLAKGTFTLDPTKKPKTIDVKLEGGEMIKGIYELSGDTFKLCYGAPGGDRPKEFATTADNGFTLAVWKRAKK
jgi:uncharacterized protein (TIGR03067 family)